MRPSVDATDGAPNLEHEVPAVRIRGRERFRREQRLRSPRDFQRVRRGGRQVRGELLLVSYHRQPQASGAEANPSRVGFSVGKRVGNAVVRNRVKRRLRDSTRRQFVMLAVGCDIILTARAGAAHATYEALDTELRDLFQRARLRTAAAH